MKSYKKIKKNDNLITLGKKIIFLPSTLSNNKKISYLNILKLNYKNDVILKDSSNINPCFVLCSNKLIQSLKITTPQKRGKNINIKIFPLNNSY